MFAGAENLAYFVCVWIVFFAARWTPSLAYTTIAVLCGIALAFPLSTFLHVGLVGEQTFFYTDGLKAIVSDKANLTLALWRVGYFVVLMVLARILNPYPIPGRLTPTSPTQATSSDL
jgi:hypothetical protein